jgi:hypothetical protein
VTRRNVFAFAAAASACDGETHADSPGSWREKFVALERRDLRREQRHLTAFKKARTRP